VRRVLFVAALLMVPVVSATTPTLCGQPYPVTAKASNQRVDLKWPAVASLCNPDGSTRPVVGYDVQVLHDGLLLSNLSTTLPRASFSLTNGQTYAFLVYAKDAQGNLGPASPPAAATPRFERDMQYLAAGLIVTWLAVFGYATFLARRESGLDRKLEQLLAHRGGRNP
jgi:CcmD family protein